MLCIYASRYVGAIPDTRVGRNYLLFIVNGAELFHRSGARVVHYRREMHGRRDLACVAKVLRISVRPISGGIR